LWFDAKRSDTLRLHCYDQDFIRTKLGASESLGWFEIPLEEIFRDNVKEKWCVLQGEKVSGGIKLGFEW
jgi:hypothetical protein